MREFAGAHICQSIIAVTRGEAQTLRDLGFADVVVIGHWREVLPTPRPFADRAGMLFVGAIHQQDSPNHDALEWFVREVLPLVEKSLGWETRLTIACYVDPAVTLEAYRDHPRITLRGPVEDIAPLYDATASSSPRHAMRRASPTRFTRRRPTACRWWRASCCAGSWAGGTGAN